MSSQLPVQFHDAIRLSLPKIGVSREKEVTIYHLLIGAILDNQTLFSQALARLGVSAADLVQTFKRVSDYIPYHERFGPPVLSQEIVHLTKDLAQKFGQEAWTIDHACLLLLTGSYDPVLMKTALAEFGIDGNQIVQTLQTLLEERQSHERRALPDSLEGIITEMGTKPDDATLSLIGRSELMDSIVTTLGLRESPNLILVGPPGVGKTSLVEALAYQIREGKLGGAFRGKRVLSLSAGQLVAGTAFRGMFEQRMTDLIRYIESCGDVILFIDEFHMLVGAGNTSGSMDAINLLKPAMARGSVRIIGATTNMEFSSHLARDPALMRRVRVLEVQPPNAEDVLKIVRQRLRHLEIHHGVRYTDEAVAAAIRIAPMMGFANPGAAIRVLDAAGSYAANVVGQQTVSLEDRIREALDRGDFTLAEQLQTESVLGGTEDATPVVGPEEVRQAIVRLNVTGKMFVLPHPGEFLAHVRTKLQTNIIGQDAAVDAVVRALHLYAAKLHNTQTPIAILLFTGPTGVGKSEMARVLAEAIYGSKDHCIEIDMAKLQQPHDIAFLTGSPPGYVGYGDPGPLENLATNPAKVLVFDEFEKAHPAVQQALLGAFDRGELMLNSGRSVNLRHALIVLTTNLGYEQGADSQIGFVASQGRPMSDIGTGGQIQGLAPELIGRINEIVTFNPLGPEEYKAIAQKILSKMANESGVPRFQFGESLMEKIAEQAMRDRKGARGLHNIINRVIEWGLRHPDAADAILSAQDVLTFDLEPSPDHSSTTMTITWGKTKVQFPLQINGASQGNRYGARR